MAGHHQRLTLEAGRGASRAICSSIAPAFPSLLLGKTLGVAFKVRSDVLFCDTALAVQEVPYETPDDPMASHTISTAQSAGSGPGTLACRRAPGASDTSIPAAAYISWKKRSDRRTAATISATPAGKELTPARSLWSRQVCRETFWKNNCVVYRIGSGGFLELRCGDPRQYRAGRAVGQKLDRRADAGQSRRDGHCGAPLQRGQRHYRWGRIIDFLKLHYVLTKKAGEDSGGTIPIQPPVPERLQGPAGAVEVPAALVLWTSSKPAGGGFPGRKLSVCAVRHGLSPLQVDPHDKRRPDRGYGGCSRRWRMPS